MNETLKQKRFLRDHVVEASGSFSMNDKHRLNDPSSNVCILVPRFANAFLLFLHSHSFLCRHHILIDSSHYNLRYVLIHIV